MTEVTRPPRENTLVVTLYESLPDVLARVRNEAGNAVRLEIPPGSPLFLTAVEYRALREVSRDRRIDLSIVSEDPLRRQLAAVFAIPVDGDERPASSRTELPVDRQRDAGSTRPNRTAPGAPPPVPNHERMGQSRTALPPLPGQPTSRTEPETPAEPAERRRWPGRGAKAPKTITNPTTTTVPVTAKDDDVIVTTSSGSRWRQLGVRTIATIAGLLILAGLVIFAVGFFLLSSATVTLRPESQPVSTELTYAILPPEAEPPEGVALTVPAEQMSLEFTTEASQSATGTRQEPGDAARGRVRLSNPNTEDVTVEAGSTLTSIGGLEFAVDQDVTVPAGDPGLGRYGGAEAAVSAAEGGTAGNIETGELSGRLDSGVYYSNRDAPLAGGTDQEIQVADAADIQALRAEAEQSLRDKIENDVAGEVPEGVEIVPESITDEDFTYTFSHQAGEDADTVSVAATAPVTLLTFRPDDAEDLVEEELRRQLSGATPDGFSFDPDSLTTTDATPVDEESSVARYQIEGSGEALAVIPDEVQTQLQEELAGDSAEAAADKISEVANVADFDIDYSPVWLPDRMPLSDGRITVEVER